MAVRSTRLFLFGFGSVRPNRKQAAAVRRMANSWGCVFLRSRRDAFAIDRKLAALPGYAKDVLIDLQNAGLIETTAYDCVAARRQKKARGNRR